MDACSFRRPCLSNYCPIFFVFFFSVLQAHTHTSKSFAMCSTLGWRIKTVFFFFCSLRIRTHDTHHRLLYIFFFTAFVNFSNQFSRIEVAHSELGEIFRVFFVFFFLYLENCFSKMQQRAQRINNLFLCVWQQTAVSKFVFAEKNMQFSFVCGGRRVTENSKGKWRTHSTFDDKYFSISIKSLMRTQDGRVCRPQRWRMMGNGDCRVLSFRASPFF